jgi:hypothetical protein
MCRARTRPLKLPVALDAVRVDDSDAPQHPDLPARRADRLRDRVRLIESRGRPIAATQAVDAVRRPRAGQQTDDVVADLDVLLAGPVQREPRVEADDAVCLGRRDRQPAARVLESAAAHPTSPILDRVQHGQQEVPLRPRHTSAVRDVVGRAFDRSEHRIHRRDLVGGRRASGRSDVH